MRINHHPAPGMGELLPGSFVVPQNPLKGPVQYIPTIGELLPGRFTVPQNPLIAQLRSGMSGLGGCCCNGSDGKGSGGANPTDTATAYVNGSPVMTAASGFVESISWPTVATVFVVGAVLARMARK